MAHLYPGHTPYHYVLNNPLLYTDPTGMWVQKLDGDCNITVVAEKVDNFKTFRQQYGMTNKEAKSFFNEHGLGDYLPTEKGGVLGKLGFKDYKTVSEGTAVGTSSVLTADVGSLSKQQLADQLVFAMEHTLQQRGDLNLGNYFSGLGRGNSRTHARIRQSDNVTLNTSQGQIPLSYLEMPILTFYKNIGMSPQPKGGPNQTTNFNYYYHGNPDAGLPPRTMTIQVGRSHRELYYRSFTR